MTTQPEDLQQLAQRKSALLAELNAIGRASLDSPGGQRREQILAEVRRINALTKAANITTATQAKHQGDHRKAAGRAEHAANLQRSASTTATVVELAKQLHAELTQQRPALPYTASLLGELTKFVAAQETDPQWAETWLVEPRLGVPKRKSRGPAHHQRSDLACPACGTDSSTGCVAGRDGAP
jgi:flagellar biosynthesis/type III secretory pathway chaperone